MTSPSLTLKNYYDFDKTSDEYSQLRGAYILIIYMSYKDSLMRLFCVNKEYIPVIKV